MTTSMREMLKKDMECEGLLECFHDLKEIDRRIFRVLHDQGDPLTVDEIAEHVDRERSTVYRALQRLLQAGFIEMEQVNYEQGGYYHVYRPRDGEEIAHDLQRMLNDWYAQMGQLIDEFGEKYATSSRNAATGES